MLPNSPGSRVLPLFLASDKPWALQEPLCPSLPSVEESFSPDAFHVPHSSFPGVESPVPPKGQASELYSLPHICYFAGVALFKGLMLTLHL